MRLWAAKSSREFNLDLFKMGQYIRAVEDKTRSENISKVLYPSEETLEGKELRLKQQYFFVSATFQDIIRRFKKRNLDFSTLPEMIAVQLNDTHPVISIPELMRILVDEENQPWEKAWDICTSTFGYTNHTIMPEALETWPVSMMKKVLPRHIQIIYEINRRFLEEVHLAYPEDAARLGRMSLIQEGEEKHVRMAHLGIVGSHSVNGVSKLHSQLLKDSIFNDFDAFYPDKFNNKTNGITPRQWLMSANPGLSKLIRSAIGAGWMKNLFLLKQLMPLADDAGFRADWQHIREENKKRLADYIHRKVGIGINLDSLIDVQVKRIHEYKRQILNLFHVITLDRRIKENPSRSPAARTVIFGGKAAPGYAMAKMIIKLINSVGETINADPEANELLKVIFLPNYCVSQAEKLVIATDLSEQISTAGMEASGTGNMKFALNGAAIIGTRDGANIEIMEEIGEENFFIFGLTVDEVKAKLAHGYMPHEFYDADAELRAVIDMINSGQFSPGEPHLFRPIMNKLFSYNEPYMVFADYRSYVDSQDRVTATWLDADKWARRSILSTARMGYFSSDRTISEYAKHIWNVRPISKIRKR
jgi:starch phosphorylase